MESLAGNAHLSKQEKLGEVSRQFEAVMLRQILQNAQKTSCPSKTLGGSAASAIYQDMVTLQLADGISKSGGFGLAQSLTAQLNHEHGVKVPGFK